MTRFNTKQSNNKGFTLIELSIVLVIIGLIVGGVLVGQDLIKAAELRATVSQLESYNTAVNTFRNKYNGIPGDLRNGATFFPAVVIAATNGNGDGDGLVEDVSAANTPCTGETCIGGENIVFWYELAQASMISDNITALSATVYNTTPGDANLPRARAGTGRVVPAARSGRNYYVLGNPGTAAASAGDVTWTAALTPTEAFQLDSKLDDGAPGTGTARAVSPTAPIANTIAATGDCNDATTYAVGSASANTLSCNMSFRSQY